MIIAEVSIYRRVGQRICRRSHQWKHCSHNRWLRSFCGQSGPCERRPSLVGPIELYGDSLIGDSSGNLCTESILGTPDHAGGTHGVFVVKYSAAGTELWARMVGGAGKDENPKLGLDGVGNVYVVGQADGAITGKTPQVGIDGFIAKLDRAGTLLWSSQFGSSTADTPGGISVDSSGNVFITGLTQGSVRGKQFGETGLVSPHGLTMDNNKNLIVVGSATAAVFSTTNSGGLDALVLKNPSNYQP